MSMKPRQCPADYPPQKKRFCTIDDSNLRYFSRNSKDDLQSECFSGMRLASLHTVHTDFVSSLSGPFPKVVFFYVAFNDRQYVNFT